MKKKTENEKAYYRLADVVGENNKDLLLLKKLVDRSVSKRVKYYSDTYGDGSVPNGTYSVGCAECPIDLCCENLDTDIKPSYCPACGQALEWWE